MKEFHADFLGFFGPNEGFPAAQTPQRDKTEPGKSSHPSPVCEDGAHNSSPGPRAPEFLIPEGSKHVFQGIFFFYLLKILLKLTYVPVIFFFFRFFFSWTNSRFKNRTLQKKKKESAK